jgi:hypothetical protein
MAEGGNNYARLLGRLDDHGALFYLYHLVVNDYRYFHSRIP